jgi:hypothetical protein
VTSAAGDLPAPRSRARRIGGLVAGLLVVAFLTAAVIDGWDRVSSYDWRFDVPFLVLAVVGVSGSLALTGAGYVLILERLAARHLPRWRLMSIWSRSMLARYVPGNVMMVAGRVVLGRESGVPGRVSLAASVYEHVFLLGLAAIASVGVLLYVGDLGQGPWLWLVAAVPFGLVILHPRVFAPLSSAVLRRFQREPLESFLSGRDVALLAGVFTSAYVFLGIGVWAIVRALTGPEAGDPLLVGAGFLLSFVVSMLAFVIPSGLGVREGILALVLARDLPGGVAIAAAAAVRLLMTLIEVAFAAAVVALERRRRAKRAPGGNTPRS